VANGRHIPVAIRRAVVARDEGQCTFVSATGKRCDERTRLEFDHVKPIGVGGVTTVENLRLRCRAHNQFAAECAYGEGFMDAKRGQARNAPVHEAAGPM
jgi:5-methylcytosine-specific restriction endonuclease McrA